MQWKKVTDFVIVAFRYIVVPFLTWITSPLEDAAMARWSAPCAVVYGDAKLAGVT
jgi:hypothetical protein